jgi:hypothetical protein
MKSSHSLEFSKWTLLFNNKDLEKKFLDKENKEVKIKKLNLLKNERIKK